MERVGEALPQGVPARKKSKSGWGTDGCRCIKVGENETLRCQRIQIRGFDHGPKVVSHISIAKIIGKDENDIRLVGNGTYFNNLLYSERSIVKIGPYKSLMRWALLVIPYKNNSAEKHQKRKKAQQQDFENLHAEMY